METTTTVPATAAARNAGARGVGGVARAEGAKVVVPVRGGSVGRPGGWRSQQVGRPALSAGAAAAAMHSSPPTDTRAVSTAGAWRRRRGWRWRGWRKRGVGEWREGVWRGEEVGVVGGGGGGLKEVLN